MRIFLISILIIITSLSCAQEQSSGYNYKFTIKGAEDTVLYLANYYGEKLYYADTARTNSKGEAVFSGEMLEQGKYALVTPGPKFFELIIADNEQIELKTDTTDFLANIEVIHSENNQIMFDYVKYISDKKIQRDALSKEMEQNQGNAAKTANLRAKFNKLNEEVSDYQLKIIEEHPDKFIAQEIEMSIDVRPPLEIQDDREKAYYWYKKHYWDNIDLKDDRVVRTSIFARKLTNFISKVLPQNPDSIISNFDEFMTNVEPGSEVYKYVVHYTTFHFETSKIMGMDKVFVHMVDNYYSDDKAFWMDEGNLESIREKAANARPTLIGKPAPELVLMDTSGKWISLYDDLKTDYTILYFYDPECGHCKKETPKLVDFYKEYKDKGVSVYAVSSDPSEKWLEFIEKNQMDFHNLSIPQMAYEDADYATKLIVDRVTTYNSLRYRETYDIFSTPKILILDKNKIIKAKDIGVDRIPELIDAFIQMETDKKAKAD